MLPNLLFGSSLIALALSLLFLHWRNQRADKQGEHGDEQREYSQAQYHRRMRVGLLLAVVGLAIIAGAYMTHPLLSAAYWLCVVLLVCWIGWLAVVDLAGSRSQLQKLREQHAAEYDALRTELARHKAAKAARPRNDGFPI